jgi:hypothetical protein
MTVGTSLLPPTRPTSRTDPEGQADTARPTDVAASQRTGRLVTFVLLVVIGAVVGGMYGLLSAWLLLNG